MPKRGRLGHDEMDYIRANAHTKSAEDIGKKLDRSEDVVRKYIRDHVPPPKAVTVAEVEDAEKITIRQELRNSEAWKVLKDEFSPEELKYFEEAYIKMMGQMQGNVLPTEEVQVCQAIKYQLLMSRNLKERKKCREDIDRLEDMQRDFLHQFGGDVSQMSDDQKDFSLNLETQLNAARQGEQSRTTEYVKLEDRHADLMKALKTTRDQRIKQVDTAMKDGFLSVIKALSTRDEQERQGRQIELVKLAGKKEYVRLGRPQTYEDGADDNPILSADTVDLGREEEPGVESSDED